MPPRKPRNTPVPGPIRRSKCAPRTGHSAPGPGRRRPGPGSPPGLDFFTVLTQPVELAGQRGKRIGIAQAERAAAEAAMAQTDRALVMETVRLFMDAVRSREWLRALDSNREGLDTLPHGHVGPRPRGLCRRGGPREVPGRVGARADATAPGAPRTRTQPGPARLADAGTHPVARGTAGRAGAWRSAGWRPRRAGGAGGGQVAGGPRRQGPIGARHASALAGARAAHPGPERRRRLQAHRRRSTRPWPAS